MVALDVNDFKVRVLAAKLIGNGIEQMGLSNSRRSINKKRIVNLAGIVGHGDGGAAGKPVGGANHEIFEGELGIEIHDGIGLPPGLIFRQLLRTKDHQGDFCIENFLHGVLDILGAAALDDFLAEGRGSIKNQLLVIELHHLRIVKPSGDHSGCQAVFHVIQNFCPDIGR